MDGYLEHMFSLEGKRAIVTGGARGISYALAEGLHDAGAEILLVDMSPTVAESAQTLGATGAPVHSCQADLTDISKLPGAYANMLELLGGRVDILVNGAGIQFRCDASEFPPDKFRKVIDVNLNAMFFISQLAGNTMIKQGGGRIINIGSMCSYFGATKIPAYAASKGGVLLLTKALSNEWAAKGVNVNAIAPGYIESALTADMKEKNPAQYEEACKRIPFGRWGKPADIKGVAVFLASEAAAYITGVSIPVDGGYTGK